MLSKAEKSYICSSLLSDPPIRLDGRALEDYRPIALETGVVPLANGSAKVCIGRPGRGGYVHEAGGVGGGTEVVVGVKLEVAGAEEDEGGGKISCTVSWYVCQFCAYPLFFSSTPLIFELANRRSPTAPLLRTLCSPRTRWTTSSRI